MQFRKLFQLLVVGGAVMGTSSGCSTPARAEQATDKKSDGGNGATASDSAKAHGADAGVADAGGGVSGW
ncbi:MAG: hypothetical protein ACXWLR_08715 [Myxococcales bacterium]